MKILPAALLLLCLESASDHDLVARPQVDRTVTTSVRSEATVTLSASRLLMDGEEVEVAGETQRTIEVRHTVAFRDTDVTVADGAVTGFKRTFIAARRTSSMRMVDPFGGEHANDAERRSPLVDAPLRFRRRDGELRAYDAEEAPVPGLRATPDWSAFLPDEPPAVGAEWVVPAGFLEHLREPGGDLGWAFVGEAEDDRELVAPPGSIRYAGELRAKLAAIEDGTARIEIEVEATTRLDLTPLLPEVEVVEHVDGPHQPTLEGILVEAEVGGSGELLWDVPAGRPRALSLDLATKEVETIDYGHSQLAAGHDVKIESISESDVVERIRVSVSAD